MDAPEATLFTAVLITCIVLGVVLSYFFVTIIRQHRRTRELYKSKILAEIATLEKERGRIAADLHDELGPLLLAVKYKVNSFDLASAEDEAVLEDTNTHIDHAIDRIRGISNDLLPEVLLRKGLVTALEQSINNVQKAVNFSIHFEAVHIPELSEQVSIHIYRLIQEVLHNTIKHARATELSIRLKGTGPLLIIHTTDNGTGFDYQTETKVYSGLGLRNLQSRVEIMNGSMYLDAAVGKGTQYTFEIPVGTAT